MGFIEVENHKKEMARVMSEMKEMRKYIRFSKHNDFAILDDDFTLAQLEAIIFTMKGKACQTSIE